jgi:hypothetical protein
VTRDVYPPQLPRGRGFDFATISRLSTVGGGVPVSGNFINGSHPWLALELVAGMVPSPRCPWGNARRTGGNSRLTRRRPAGPTALSGAVFSPREKITPSGSRAYAIDPFRLLCVAASAFFLFSISTVPGSSAAKLSVAVSEHGS